MSIAVAARALHLIEPKDYEPVSDGSRTIRRMWARDRNYQRGSAADWSPTIESALFGIRSECTQPGWDGAGARPVSDITISLVAKIAECLFTLLPGETPAPDLVPEPDGEICMSWSVGANRLFAVSVGEHGKMNFAGQFGAEGAYHGWLAIDPTSRSSLEVSLQDIVRYVDRLFAQSTIRRAA